MKDQRAERPDTDWLAQGRQVLDIEIQGLEAVRGRLGPSFVRTLELMAGCSGCIVVTGLGKSGLVGRKIAATLSSTGTPAYFLHPVEGAHGDMGLVRPGDVVLALSNSGETAELNAILPSLRAMGAVLVALTGNPCSTLGRLADEVVDVSVPKEACPHNLAPTASTTAALAVGDALAVGLMGWKRFGEQDFARFHPGGALGLRLQQRAGDLMRTRDVPVVPETASYGEALRVLNDGGVGTVLVADGQGRLAGIVTDGDVRRLVCRGSVDPDQPVARYMTRDPRRGLPGQTAAELLDIMEGRLITVLPVVDAEGRILGVVHLHDLLGKGRVKFSE